MSSDIRLRVARSRLSRRDALSTGLAAGLTALMWRSPAVSAEARPAPAPESAQASNQALSRLPLITRLIPKTGERLPAIGLGTDKFRDDERDAIQAEIGRMQQMGGTVIDTSADYGESEGVIGAALTVLGIRERMFVATKLTAGGSFDDDVGGQRSFNRSLKRLQTQRVDLLQVHNLDGVDTLMPLMQRWKRDGRLRYLGITTSEVDQHGQMVEYMHKYPLDFVQVDYSLANRAAAADVLPLALQRRIGVLVNLPFGFGSVIREAQRRRLPAWAADIDVHSWAQFLLKYVISHPAVTCAIPGSTQVAHLEDNQGAARGRLPDSAMRRRMEQFWDAR